MAKYSRNRGSRRFGPIEKSSPEGLLAIGGPLDTDRLIDAYRRGIFPWPADDMLLWWSPDPRAVLEFDRLHIPRRLARTWRSGRFDLSIDRAFDRVISLCASTQDRAQGAWLTEEMIAAYCELHCQGIAHSVEAWHDGQLAGGIYGISTGAIFSAESMFHLVRDASKIALVALLLHLQSRSYEMVDIQQMTAHLAQFGAREIPRREFLTRLSRAVERPITFGDSLDLGRELPAQSSVQL